MEFPVLPKGTVTTFGTAAEVFKNPIETHTADSKWQYCNCRTCQRHRAFLDSLPGPKIDYDKLRLKDER